MTSGFITLEGIDGCGKSVLAKIIVGRLRGAGMRVTQTREPTRSWLGGAVRRSYREEISPYTEAFLFLADRATHTLWIKEQMALGKVVVCDRYSDSTVAYQAALLHQKLGGDTDEYMRWLLDMSRPAIIPPDITLLLDVDPKVSLKRLKSRKEMEKFETLENLRQVRRNYLELARMDGRIKIIDASKSITDVKEQVFTVLGQHFGIEL
ncbi:MAG: dTMP kinase [Thermoplasmata archaeon]